MSHNWTRTFRRVVRLQRRTPAAALLIVLTLAIGIGADVTVFSVVDPLLLRALPFTAPDRLDVISSAFPRGHMSGMGLSGPEVLELSDMTHAFAAIGAASFGAVTVGTGDGTVRASLAEASAPLLQALEAKPITGRLYGPEDDRDGAASVAVISYAFWQRAFAGNPGIAGRTIDIDGRSTLVTGVMPPRADLLNRQIDVWKPLALTTATAGSRSDHRYTVIARRRPGVSEAAAAADLTSAVEGWQRATGEFNSPMPGIHPLERRPLVEATSGPSARPLGALSAAVILVLLLACANVANLMLARAEGRRTELAIEVALGASTPHLAQVYIAEALLFSTAGSAVGVGLAAFALRGLKSFGSALVRPEEIAINGRVLLFTAAAAVLTSVVIGMAPLLRLDVGRAYQWLQAGGRGSIGARDRTRLQQALVAVQIAAAVALSVTGIVTVRSLIALTRVDLGFRPDVVLRTQISLPQAAYREDAQVWTLYDRMLVGAAGLPGVRAAAVMSGLPPQRPANNTTFMVDGATTFDHTNVPQVDFIQHVSPAYFAVMGIPIRAGRVFTEGDRESAMPVAIVNETLARRFWPGQSPVGHRLHPGMAGVAWFTVVGVAADVRQNGLQSPPGAELYVPYRQSRILFSTFVPRDMNLVVTSSGDPLAVAPAIPGVIRAIEPAAAISGTGLMEGVVARTIAQPRMLTSLLTAFAIVAVILAAVGVYGVTSGSVSTRTSEFGVRVALGATPRDVIGLVLRSAGAPLAAGILAGSAAAAAAMRYLATVLFAVDPRGLGPIAGAAALLSLVALAALAVPAIRATRLNPTTALRSS